MPAHEVLSYKTSRGGSRISGKGDHIYIKVCVCGGGGGGGFADFISFFLNIS